MHGLAAGAFALVLVFSSTSLACHEAGGGNKGKGKNGGNQQDGGSKGDPGGGGKASPRAGANPEEPGPPNQTGNPAIGIEINGKLCQATANVCENGKWGMTTAGHCVDEGEGPQTVRTHKNAFGVVKAQVTRPPSVNGKQPDIAFLAFQGPPCDEAKVQVIPLGVDPAPGTDVHLGLRMAARFQKDGMPWLAGAKLGQKQTVLVVNGRGEVDLHDQVRLKTNDSPIQSGDSGGPVVVEEPSLVTASNPKGLRQVAVLSTGNPDALRNGGVVGTSWARTQAEALQSNSLRLAGSNRNRRQNGELLVPPQ